MKAGWLVRSLLWSALLFATEAGGLAQMRPVAKYKGEMLPVVDCDDVYLYVLKDGHKKETGYGDYTIQPAPAFGAGFVEIQNIKVDLDPLKNATARERAKTDSVNFRYEADLSGDRDLRQCFALLTFAAKGSVGTWFAQVGRLRKGVAKHVQIAFRDRVDSVGLLHVFSEGAEIPSSQVQKPYDLKAYYASLLRGSSAPSALELLKTESIFPHVLSRDGRRLATLRDRDTHYSLIGYDLEAKKLLCDVRVGSYEDLITGLTWVSDHEVVYISNRDFAFDFDYYWPDFRHRELMLLDVNTGKFETIRDRVDTVVMSLMSQPEILVVRDFKYGVGSWVTKFNVRTRKEVGSEDSGDGLTMFDRNGNQRLLYRQEGTKAHYEFKPTPTSRWKDLDSCVKTPGLTFDVAAKDVLDRVADIHGLGPDGDILYISSRLNSDVFQLAAFSMSEGVVKQTIASIPRYDLTDNDFGLTRLLFRKASPELIGVIYEASKPAVTWLDPGFSAVQRSIDKTFPDHVNVPIDWSEDGSAFIYFSSSDQDPGTFYSYRPLESVLMPLLVLGDRLKGKKLATTVPIDFAARDGAVIHAYVTTPPEPPAAGLPPLVVDIHGGPMARDEWGFDAERQFLATRGYVVLQVNYRGSSGYGAKYQSAGLRARLDTVVIDDIADGVRQLIKDGKVDPARIGVIGASFGGWATYMSLIRYPELYRAGVAISAISHWRNFLKKDRWKSWRKVSYVFWRSLLDRQDFKNDEPLIDPYLRAAEIKQPIYIIHGENDYIVDADEAKMMVKALRKTNPHVESLYFPATGHTYDEWSFVDKVRRLNEIGGFLDRYLQADQPAKPAGDKGQANAGPGS